MTLQELSEDEIYHMEYPWHRVLAESDSAMDVFD